MVDYFRFAFLQFLQQRQAVHPRHIDVGNDQIDVAILFQHRQSFDAVMGEQKVHRPVADLAAEFLQDQRLKVRLVVNNQDACGHAAFIHPGFDFTAQQARNRSAWSEALGAAFQRFAFGLGVAIGGDHDDRYVGPRRLRLG